MGFENRDYARESTSGSSWRGTVNPTSSMVKPLVFATVGVFIAQLLTHQPGVRGMLQRGLVEDWLALDPISTVYHGQIWRLLTYAFCHSVTNLLHIVFNMYLVWMLGRQMEALYGAREFLLLYLASAMFAGLTNVAFGFASNNRAGCIGASGAVSAMFVLFAMHYPRQKIYLFGIIGIEARWLVGGFVFIDLVMALADLGGRGAGTNIAYAAHLGGAIFGYIYFTKQLRLESLWSRLTAMWSIDGFKRKGNPDLRVYQPEPRESTDSLSAQVDRILAKISEHGESSLTDKERETLNAASRRLRNR